MRGGGTRGVTANTVQIQDGVVKLDFTRRELARVDVVGVDVIFTLSSGAQVLVPNLALQAVSPQPPTIQLSGGLLQASELIENVGKVDLAAEARIPLASPADGVPLEEAQRRGRRAAAASAGGEADSTEPPAADIPTQSTPVSDLMQANNQTEAQSSLRVSVAFPCRPGERDPYACPRSTRRS